MSKLASVDRLHKSEQPIRSHVSKLTQLLTMPTTHKFALQVRSQRAGNRFRIVALSNAYVAATANRRDRSLTRDTPETAATCDAMSSDSDNYVQPARDISQDSSECLKKDNPCYPRRDSAAEIQGGWAAAAKKMAYHSSSLPKPRSSSRNLHY